MSNDMAEDESIEELPKSKLSELYKMVDENKSKLIDVLKTAVAIPSVSHETKHIPDILKMVHLCDYLDIIIIHKCSFDCCYYTFLSCVTFGTFYFDHIKL